MRLIVVFYVKWMIALSKTNFKEGILLRMDAGQHIVDNHMIFMLQEVGPSLILRLSMGKKEEKRFGKWLF